MNTKITNVGVNDYEIDLFESQYILENGMAYNSYLIDDKKIAVCDGVDKIAADRWLANLDEALQGRTPDYLIVHHLEPDHSYSIQAAADKYPEMTVVVSATALRMLPQFCDIPADRAMAVKENDTLSLGEHTLTFMMAPMVHWPEVMVSYESAEKTLFSADAFGKFGTTDADEGWSCEARRYYFNIVGKYGAQVQALLAKAGKLDIQRICPLHGPELTDTIPEVLRLYDTWSKYEPEDHGAFIAVASIHGNTHQAALELKKILEEKGCPRVAFADLTRDDIAECVEDAFRHSVLVCMASSYDAGVFAPMADFLHHLKIKTFRNRHVALVENTSWAPSALKTMRAEFEGMQNITVLKKTVSIKTRVTAQTRDELDALADEIIATVQAVKNKEA